MRHKQDIKLDGFVQLIRASPVEGLTTSMNLVPVREERGFPLDRLCGGALY